MKDYHDHYIKGVILLLSDVFETFRDMAMNTYHLDPAQYYSLPGYSWDAMLRLTSPKNVGLSPGFPEFPQVSPSKF